MNESECTAQYFDNFFCDKVIQRVCSSPIWSRIMPLIFALVLVPPLVYVYKYNAAIRERFEEIERRNSKFKVVRDRSVKTKNRIRCLELHPSFVDEIKDDWNVMSLGQYLSQLRPFSEECNRFLKKELELTIGKTLLSVLGKTFGSALLPVLGTSSVDGVLSKVAGGMATYVADNILSEDEMEGTIEDIAALDLELPELISALNLNQKMNSPDLSQITSSLDLFKMGEVGYGDLSYHNEEKHEKGFPSPFVIERDFKKFIADMEEETKNKNGGVYDPDDKSLAAPTPVNERILPDLYFGAGDAKCTHTKRECIENRLVGFLLTRLSHNFYKKLHGETDLFEVQWNGKTCRFPEEFIQALIKSGHKVEVCPKVTNACFGAFLCAKEEDGSFANIPVCIQIRTGVERSSDSRPSYFVAPHGGLEINITGPFIGVTNFCAIQFYVSAEGLTAFYANQDVDVPWLERVPLSRMYTNAEAVTAVRMAGMVAHVYNKIGADMNLPCGGYGVLGMCNDSATIIDYAIRGETTAYPLLATGRYLNHIFNYLVDLKDGLKNDPEMGKAVNDLKKLIKSSVKMPNDLHVSPATITDCAKRFNATYSKCVFQKTEDSKAVMTEAANKYKEYAKMK